MKHILPFFLIVGLLFTACRSGRSVADKYFLIEFDKAQSGSLADRGQPVNKSCYLAPVWVYPAFSTHQIALRSNTHELSYFSFNEWAVRPADSFEEILLDFFKENAVFRTFTFAETIYPAELRLETRVLRLEVLTTNTAFAAHLQLEFLLYDQPGNTLLLRHVSAEQRELENRNLNDFAASIGALFTEALYAFSHEVISTLIEE
jgi:ABC-type uncharacterized transport system auxiliary subunit